MKKEFLKNGLYCYTDEFHKFTVDSLILAELLPRFSRGIELCAGNGVIGLSVLDDKQCLDFAEISEKACALLITAVNEQCLPCRVFCVDVRDFASAHKSEYDTVFFNPPYYKKESGKLPKNPERAGQKFELWGTLSEFISCGALLLNPNGRLVFSIKPERADEAAVQIKIQNMFVYRKDMFFYDCHSPAFLCCITAGFDKCEPTVTETYLKQNGKYSLFYENLYKSEDK